MTQTSPVTQVNPSPFPTPEAPHATTQASTPPLTDVLGTARDKIAPLQANATSFAKSRPFATAALVGTVALALFGSLRGSRTNGKKAA